MINYENNMLGMINPISEIDQPVICPFPVEIEQENLFFKLKDEDFHYDDNGLLATHGIDFCAYSAGSSSYGDDLWDYVVRNESGFEPENAYLQFNVLGVRNYDFYDLLSEFNQIENGPERFDLAKLANFFKEKGYEVMEAR